MRKRWASRSEWSGLFLVLAALGVYLLSTYTLKPHGDPGRWYDFGRNFVEGFGNRKLAYGFPMLVAVAIKVMGPLPAFLINIPILLILVACLYFVAGELVLSGGPARSSRARLAGVTAVLLFVALDKLLFRALVNPYRDPAAFVWLLLSVWLFLRFRRDASHSPWWLVVSGFAFGMACSTRETCGLALFGMLLYAVVEKLRDRTLPFWKAGIVFAASLAVTCVPLAWQNYLVSGNAALPAQAIQAAGTAGSIAPGIKTSHFAKTFPLVLEFLWNHYAWWGTALLAVGIAWSVVKRNRVALCLSLPVAAGYLLFYGSYLKVVGRYLFVLDLFLVPVMAAGCAALMSALLEKIKPSGDAIVSRKVRLSLVISLITVAGILWGAFEPAERFRLSHAGRLQEGVHLVLEENARTLAERPLRGVLRSFTHVDASALEYLADTREIRDPESVPALRRIVDREGPVYLGVCSEKTEDFVRREYDLELIGEFASKDYGLRDILDSKTFRLFQIVPWSQTLVQVPLQAKDPGRAILSLDVGHISGLRREWTRVWWNETLLDEDPMDNVNYYAVDVEPGNEPASLRVESSHGLPGRIHATLQPSDEPIHLHFKKDLVIKLGNRLSPSFRQHPRWRHPAILESGYVIVPIVDSRDALFVFSALIRVTTDLPDEGTMIRMTSGDTLLFSESIKRLVDPREDPWQWISFSAGEPVVRAPNARLDWRVEQQGQNPCECALSLDTISVSRIEPKKQFAVAFGEDGDRYAIIDGLRPAEQLRHNPEVRWRWTMGRARIRIILLKDKHPTRITVGYYDENRPAVVVSPLKRILVNAMEFPVSFSTNTVHGLKYVEATILVPEGGMTNETSVLEIVSEPWDPSEFGIGNLSREYGIMLDAVTAEREWP